MNKLSEDKIQTIFPQAYESDVEMFVTVFNKYSKNFGFSDDFHVNMFLAELREEIGPSLTPIRENLNYSCKALKGLFGYYKKRTKEAEQDGWCSGHIANQRNIANKAYGNRIGNKLPHDGWTFRRHGFIQTAGRANFTKIANIISELTHLQITAEDLAADDTVEAALLSAMSYFYMNKLYKTKNIDEMTKKINKFTKSYAKRKLRYKEIAKLA